MAKHGLESKVALVIGASKGIGRAVALRLARDGAAVVVNYLSSAEHARKTVAEIQAAGRRAVTVQADVGRTDEIEKLFDATFCNFGRLDILVNNAKGPSSRSPAVWQRSSVRAGSPSTRFRPAEPTPSCSV